METPCFYTLCYHGNTDAVQSIINQANEIELMHGLFAAYDQNHIDIVKLIINSIKFNNKLNAYRVFRHACDTNRLLVIKFMLEKGYNYIDHMTTFTSDQMRDVLNLGLNEKYVNWLVHNDIIVSRNTAINQFKRDADDVLYKLYKNKQIYDRHVLNIVAEYISY